MRSFLLIFFFLTSFLNHNQFSVAEISNCEIDPFAYPKGGICFGGSCGEGYFDPMGAILLEPDFQATAVLFENKWGGLKWRMEKKRIVITGKISAKELCPYCSWAPVHLMNCAKSTPKPLWPFICDAKLLKANGCEIAQDDDSGSFSRTCSEFCELSCANGLKSIYGITKKPIRIK